MYYSKSTCLTIFFFYFHFINFSQTILQGLVKDSKTNESLAYCSLAIKGTTKYAITNDEGLFSISVNLTRDTILFSFVGYETLPVPAITLSQYKTVFLRRKDILLQEVTVYAKNDFLYNILDKCRGKLLKDQRNRMAKVYYGIETQTKDQPIEMVECYYNGSLEGPVIEKLDLKNGRIGLAVLDDRYFLTLNTSKAIINLGLTSKNDHYPSFPLQLSKKEMKKKFSLELVYTDDKMHRIKFYPRNEQNNSFSGEIWVDKETFSLLKADLIVRNTSRHPFIPFVRMDSLYNVDLAVSYTYKQEAMTILPDHINFSYHVTYKSVRDTPAVLIPSIITRDINTKGVLYFYDYDNPFILPYFEYDSDLDDYRKMSIIPYNVVFWKNNNTILLTEKQKENLGFFSREGCLINFREGNFGKDFLTLKKNVDSNFYEHFYEDYYSFWSSDKRIALNKKMPQNETYSQEKINRSIQSDLYHLKVQILLDVTQLDDSLNCKSYTVFDAVKTSYHLPEQPCTKAFLNIYFDICEIERRKMEQILNASPHTVNQVDAIYKKTIESIDVITQRYVKEVQLGMNEKSLRKWNNYVMENLTIDNLKIFQGINTNR